MQDKNIIVMTMRFTIGFGVDLVVAEQIEYFLQKNNRIKVLVQVLDEYYDKRFKKFLESNMLQVLKVDSLSKTLEIVAETKPDIIFFHTPPFYSLIPEIDKNIFKIFYDYGEPPAELFPDKENRIKIRDEKTMLAKSADLRFSISKFIQKDSGIENTKVNWLGNDHLLKKKYDLNTLAGQFRKKHNLMNKFLVLNVSRYYYGDRYYKGIDKYIDVKEKFFLKYPVLKEKVAFVIAGASGPRDRNWASSFGLFPVSNLSEEELVSVYLDADYYLSTSMWEGYNLGLAQALSFGMQVGATDKGAHSEFGISVSNNMEFLADQIFKFYNNDQKLNDSIKRIAKQQVYSWQDSVQKLEELIDQNI